MIDTTYFTGYISVAGLASVGVSNQIESDLNVLIQKFEKHYLQTFFGAEMYLAYVDETDTGTNIVAGSRWDSLINGLENGLDAGGRLVLWEGILRTSPKESLLADYIYCKYLESKLTDSSISGEVVSVAENSQNASPLTKMVNAWNNMVKCGWQMHTFLMNYKENDIIAFPEYMANNYYFAYSNYAVDGCFPNLLQPVNSLGI